MEKKILIAEKHIDCCCNPPAKDGEHASSLNVFAWVTPAVAFVVAIIVVSFSFCLPFIGDLQEMLLKRGTGNEELVTGNEQWATGNGKQATGDGQRRRANGQRERGNGEQRTGNRERGTEHYLNSVVRASITDDERNYPSRSFISKFISILIKIASAIEIGSSEGQVSESLSWATKHFNDQIWNVTTLHIFSKLLPMILQQGHEGSFFHLLLFSKMTSILF